MELRKFLMALIDGAEKCDEWSITMEYEIAELMEGIYTGFNNLPLTTMYKAAKLCNQLDRTRLFTCKIAYSEHERLFILINSINLYGLENIEKTNPYISDLLEYFLEEDQHLVQGIASTLVNQTDMDRMADAIIKLLMIYDSSGNRAQLIVQGILLKNISNISDPSLRPALFSGFGAALYRALAREYGKDWCTEYMPAFVEWLQKSKYKKNEKKSVALLHSFMGLIGATLGKVPLFVFESRKVTHVQDVVEAKPLSVASSH